MPRPRKDHSILHLTISKEIDDKFRAYAAEKGQPLTVCMERILTEFFAVIESRSVRKGIE